MHTVYQQKNLTWVDVVAPSSDEVHKLIATYKIPLEFATDLTTITPHNEIKAKKGYLKITFDYPIVKRTDLKQPHEIKFIATKSTLLTIRYEDIEAVDRFARGFEVLTLLRGGANKRTGGYLLTILLKHLYSSLLLKLDYLETRLLDIEEGIFAQREKEMVFEISTVNRRLITFRQTITAHEPLLKVFETKLGEAFSNEEFFDYMQVVDEFNLVKHRLRALSKTLDELRQTNNSLLTTKQNEVMKTFTILAFITFPLTLFSSMFGMNTLATPVIGHKYDFWIIVGIMICASIIFFTYFRHKRWM